MNLANDRRSPTSPPSAATAPSKEEIAAKFRALVDKRYGSQLRASKVLGIPRVTLQRALAGEQLPGAPLLVALAADGEDVTALLRAGRSPGKQTPFVESTPPDDQVDDGQWPVENKIASGVLPLFDRFLPGKPSGYAGRAVGSVAVPEAWARPHSYAVWFGERRTAERSVLTEDGLRYPAERPEVGDDVLIVWTGPVPNWTPASPVTRDAGRDSVRHTFVGAKREDGDKTFQDVSAVPVVLHEGVPVLSFVHTGVLLRHADAAYQYAERRGEAPEVRVNVQIVGYATYSLGRFRAGAGGPR